MATSTAGESPRYIGSKSRLADKIGAFMGAPPEGTEGVFVDAFCGTGAIAVAAADRGWAIRLNDHLPSSVALARARLLAESDVPFERLGGYRSAIGRLNEAAPEKGFFWRQYSPASAQARMYFTEANAMRIDAARRLIAAWEAEGALQASERELLLADLITAAARVANTAGTYGCFLTRWSSTSERPLRLLRRDLREAPVPHTTFSRDVLDVPVSAHDLVYFDPPYTKRQYAAYYHINETLFHGDEPELIGKTGLRPWRSKASPYCYKLQALQALSSLIANTSAQRILLSYSRDGHVDLADLVAAIAPEGSVAVHEVGEVGRYRPNRAASAGSSAVAEYLIEMQRAPVAAPTSLVA